MMHGPSSRAAGILSFNTELLTTRPVAYLMAKWQNHEGEHHSNSQSMRAVRRPFMSVEKQEQADTKARTCFHGVVVNLPGILLD